MSDGSQIEYDCRILRVTKLANPKKHAVSYHCIFLAESNLILMRMHFPLTYSYQNLFLGEEKEVQKLMKMSRKAKKEPLTVVSSIYLLKTPAVKCCEKLFLKPHG